jgi:hypothetical protein
MKPSRNPIKPGEEIISPGSFLDWIVSFDWLPSG